MAAVSNYFIFIHFCLKKYNPSKLHHLRLDIPGLTRKMASIKTHDDFQLLISGRINDIHGELDKILKVVVEGKVRILCTWTVV